MIIEKTYQNEEEWLNARENYITATQVAKKTTQKLNIAQNPAIIWGKQREPIILENHREYLEKTGRIDYNPLRMFIDEAQGYAATPDALIRNKNNTPSACIEIKTAKHNLAWITKTKQTQTLQNPIYYDQIQWQLYLTQSPKCILIIETHLNYNPIEEIIIHINPNPERIKQLKKTAELLKTHTNLNTQQAITLIEKTQEKNKLEEEIQNLKTQLLNQYQPEDYTNKTHQGYKIIYTQPTTRTTINTSKLKQEHPEIAARYQTTTKTQASLKIRKINTDSKNQTENDPRSEQ